MNDRPAGKATPTRPDPAGFIKANMRLAPVAALPEIQIFSAPPGSGLR
ncbi:methyltransferase, partial [bacterium M00.F.Ca.ET.228.01.1.1]